MATVKKHTRQLPSGKTVTVRRHQRDVPEAAPTEPEAPLVVVGDEYGREEDQPEGTYYIEDNDGVYAVRPDGSTVRIREQGDPGPARRPDPQDWWDDDDQAQDAPRLAQKPAAPPEPRAAKPRTPPKPRPSARTVPPAATATKPPAPASKPRTREQRKADLARYRKARAELDRYSARTAAPSVWKLAGTLRKRRTLKGRWKALTSYRRARARARSRGETARYHQLNQAVIDAEKNISWWRR